MVGCGEEEEESGGAWICMKRNFSSKINPSFFGVLGYLINLSPKINQVFYEKEGMKME